MAEKAESESAKPINIDAPEIDGYALVKEERMHSDMLKQIRCDKETGRIVQRIVAAP